MNYEDRVTKAAVEAAIAGKCALITGTYTGDGTAARTFNLGVTPKAVIVRSARTISETEMTQTDYRYAPFITVAGLNYAVLRIVDGGFAINQHVMVNENGRQYLYLAFV